MKPNVLQPVTQLAQRRWRPPPPRVCSDVFLSSVEQSPHPRLTLTGAFSRPERQQNQEFAGCADSDKSGYENKGFH